MPLHPAQRAPAQTLEEDREAVILADRLGFYDAFVGEHLTERSENITSSFIFLASLVYATERIKLGTGTSNLSHSHPVLIASHAAMLDHMAPGRFIFGVRPGALRSDAEALGLLDEDRNKLGVIEKFKPQGIEPMPLKPAEFDVLIVKEIESNKAIVKAAGLKFN